MNFLGKMMSEGGRERVILFLWIC